MVRTLAALALVAVVGACGDDATEVRSAPEATAAQRYTASGMVLESPKHGPELCSQWNSSYPPQCGGAAVVGWEWAAVEGEESASGSTWGTYRLVGTWDGARLTLTEPPGPPEDAPGRGVDLTTPCPAPPGGWAVVDPATASDEGRAAASDYAAAQPDFAGSWVDEPAPPIGPEPVHDPTQLVLNVRFAGDLDRHEAALRSVWGGALCVTQAQRPLAELRAIQEEVFEPLDALGASVDHVTGVVDVRVHVADPAVQRDLDARYGEGTVVLTGFLQPVDG